MEKTTATGFPGTSLDAPPGDLTERKQAEAALRESQRFIQSVAATSPHWLYVFDFDTMGPSYENRPILRDLGYPPKVYEAISTLEAFRTFMPPEEMPHLARLMGEWQALADGQVRSDEYYMRDADHQVHCFAGREIVFARRADGSVQRVLGLMLDITESKRAERELQLTRDTFQTVLEHTPSAILVTDAQGRFVLTNPAAEMVLGGPPTGDAKGPASGYTLHKPDGSPFASDELPLVRALQGKAYPDVELLVRRADGSQVLALAAATPLLDAAGKINGAVAVMHDITERKQAEAALRESQERFRVMFEGHGAAMLLIEPDSGQIADANTAAAGFYGYSREQLRAMRIDQINQLAPEDVAVELRSAVSGTRNVFVFLHRLASGDVRTVEVYSTPVTIQRRLMLFSIIHDVTERKRAEDALHQAQAELRQHAEHLEKTVQERTAQLRKTVGELEHFSYSITHDMRAPLRAMRSFASLLLNSSQSSLDPTDYGYLQCIATAADRMDQLIVDALDYSKAVREEVALGVVDPEALLRGMIESYPAFHPPHAEILIQGKLPAVLANPAGLTQCFSNLLHNAVKFVEPGQLPRVQVSAEVRDSVVRLWFADNGIGIAREHQERVFAMFQRLGHNYEGTGIGLALVRKVVEKMGGSVGVESEPGRGSRFWLELQPASERVAL